MSWETARRAVDFGWERSHPHERLEINFFGGEPLLRFPLIQQIVAYAKERAVADPRTLLFSITTNGTILTEEMIQFFATEAIDLCFSLDGPKAIHDRHRVYPDGRGSFEDVVANLQRALMWLPRVQVNAVYGPDTLAALPETVALLLELKAPIIHLNLNITAPWDATHREQFAPVYDRIAILYRDAYRQEQEVAINLIDGKIILFLKGGYSEQDTCGMGRWQWAFAPSGNIYPCERFIGEDDDPRFQLGNLYTGVAENRRMWIMHLAGNRNPECLECELRPYCMNWCGCTNYHTTGRVNLAGPTLCAHERAAIDAARFVLSTLSREANALFTSHFLHYIREARTEIQPVA